MNSMTGFGSASRRDRKVDVEVEMRSVNHRFLSLKQGLPEGLTRHEPEIEQLVRSRVSRGSVTVSVSLRAAEEAGAAMPDLATLRRCHRRLKEIGKALAIPGEVELEDLLAVPTLWTNSGGPARAAGHWPAVRKLVARALEGLAAARAREGGKIARDLRARLDAIEGHVDRIQARVPVAVEAYQKKLDERVQALLAQKGLQGAQPDLAKEIALFADRCDISEEVQRLRAHVSEFRRVLPARGQLGRRLDFLTQEMGRETNTMASKGNDAEISSRAVQIKAELEKIKEQVENIE